MGTVPRRALAIQVALLPVFQERATAWRAQDEVAVVRATVKVAVPIAVGPCGDAVELCSPLRDLYVAVWSTGLGHRGAKLGKGNNIWLSLAMEPERGGDAGRRDVGRQRASGWRWQDSAVWRLGGLALEALKEDFVLCECVLTLPQ